VFVSRPNAALTFFCISRGFDPVGIGTKPRPRPACGIRCLTRHLCRRRDNRIFPAVSKGGPLSAVDIRPAVPHYVIGGMLFFQSTLIPAANFGILMPSRLFLLRTPVGQSGDQSGNPSPPHFANIHRPQDGLRQAPTKSCHDASVCVPRGDGIVLWKFISRSRKRRLLPPRPVLLGTSGALVSGTRFITKSASQSERLQQRP